MAIGRVLIASVVALILVPGSRAVTSGIEYKFRDVAEGEQPQSLISDAAGNIYGTTYYGGQAGCGGYLTCGTVFEMTRNQDGSWSKSVIYKFTGGSDGGTPGSRLTFDSEGNLYGTTLQGGGILCSSSCGTVFKLSPSGDGRWAISTLYTFQGGGDGAGPTTGVIFDSSGNLYGTAEGGGVCNPGCNGGAFKLTPGQGGSWTETTLYSFLGGADGYYLSALVFDTAGNLYGTTTYGGDTQGICGAQGCGKVFQLTPNQDASWTENVLYAFTDGADGGYPISGVTFDTGGNLYGETINGGDFYCENAGCGVVFELAPNATGAWKETVLHTFHGQDGAQLEGGLVFDTSGDLYGTSTSGGSNPACPFRGGCGTIFELSPKAGGGFIFKPIGAFNDTDGADPATGVIVDSVGNLYGTTYTGGDLNCSVGGVTGGCGVVFEIAP